MSETNNAEGKIATWYGKPVGDMTRGELIDALDWCCKRLQEHAMNSRATALGKVELLKQETSGVR